METSQEDGAMKLKFRITHGAFNGAKHTERINNPKYVTSPMGIEMAKKKSTCYASRFGLVDESANGKTVTVNWKKIVGRECVFKLHTRPDKKTGNEYQNIEFDVFVPGHPKLPAAAYQAVGLPVPANAPKGKSEKNETAAPAEETVEERQRKAAEIAKGFSWD